MTETNPKLMSRVRALVERGERISVDDCRALFEVRELLPFARIARVPRERRFGRSAFYRAAHVVTYRGGDASSFITGMAGSISDGASELVVRCTLAPTDSLATWRQRLSGLSRAPLPTVVAVTAGSLIELANAGGVKTDVVIETLAGAVPIWIGGEDAGLLGSTEISFDAWLDLHRVAHRLGLKTGAGMLYLPSEEPERYAAHLDAIRSLQDETGGFVQFTPIACHDTAIEASYRAVPSAAQTLRMTAIARIVLDNIPHIAIAPALVTAEVAYVALGYGADTVETTVTAPDVNAGEHHPLDLTVVDESVAASAVKRLVDVRDRIVEARWTPHAVDHRFRDVEVSAIA